MDPLLVILDLDDTLIHAQDGRVYAEPHFYSLSEPIIERPHVRPFLAELLASYRVAVWTSAGSIYAEAVVRNLFPDPAALAFVWSDERCTQHFNHETRGHDPLKVLAKVRRRLGYNLDRVLMVDDSPEKHVRNYGNLVRVQPFEGDPDDDELPALLAYIHSIATAPSVRSIEKRGWRTRAARVLPQNRP